MNGRIIISAIVLTALGAYSQMVGLAAKGSYNSEQTTYVSSSSIAMPDFDDGIKKLLSMAKAFPDYDRNKEEAAMQVIDSIYLSAMKNAVQPGDLAAIAAMEKINERYVHVVDDRNSKQREQIRFGGYYNSTAALINREEKLSVKQYEYLKEAETILNLAKEWFDTPKKAGLINDKLNEVRQKLIYAGKALGNRALLGYDKDMHTNVGITFGPLHGGSSKAGMYYTVRWKKFISNKGESFPRLSEEPSSDDFFTDDSVFGKWYDESWGSHQYRFQKEFIRGNFNITWGINKRIKYPVWWYGGLFCDIERIAVKMETKDKYSYRITESYAALYPKVGFGLDYGLICYLRPAFYLKTGAHSDFLHRFGTAFTFGAGFAIGGAVY